MKPADALGGRMYPAPEVRSEPISPSYLTSTWEHDIRALEEEARQAFLAADLPTLERLWSDDFAVNSPIQRILTKREVLGALKSRAIWHHSFELEIESLVRHGDTVIVMGHDRVIDPPDGAISRRRFTNVWLLEDTGWRVIARHAHVTSRARLSGTTES